MWSLVVPHIVDSGQAGCGGSAQWDWEPGKKPLKAIRMDPERIRKVMSEVIGLCPRVESLRGCKLGTFADRASDSIAPRSAGQGGIRGDAEPTVRRRSIQART